jgi:predicted DNA binding CopG/RHH family protein
MGNPGADYTDDQGEIVGELRPARDFLPPRDDGVKVTLTLSRGSVEFFKREARRNRVPYQRMIRALVDEYAKRHA